MSDTRIALPPIGVLEGFAEEGRKSKKLIERAYRSHIAQMGGTILEETPEYLQIQFPSAELPSADALDNLRFLTNREVYLNCAP